MRPLLLLAVAALLICAPTPATPAPDPLTGTAFSATLAGAAARAGQWQAAARLWRTVTLTRTQDARAWAGLGTALLQTGEPADAAIALDKALALGGADAALWRQRGRAAVALADAAGAQKAFTALLQLAPDDAGGWTGLGVAHDLAGDHAAAAKAYDKALALDPLHAAARHNLALSRQLAGANPP